MSKYVKKIKVPKTKAQIDARAAKVAKANLARKNALSRASQDIGKIPPIKNRRRRKKAESSFRAFCEKYLPEVFYLPWSKDLLRVIAKIERVVIHHQTFAVAMPRGSGKTQLCLAAALWAVLTGQHSFVMVIGAVAAQSEDAIRWFKRQLSENALLLEDFPEVCYPIHGLEGESRRTMGQRHKGKKTGIMWSSGRIILPTIQGSKASGAIIGTASLDGHIRGVSLTMPGGRVVRPTLALCDDPQTDEPLDTNTPMPTPWGFVRIGDLEVGDVVFDGAGKQCRVTATSGIMAGRPCYEICFDDGTSIVASESHKWITGTTKQRTNARRAMVPAGSYTSVRTTGEIAATTYSEDDGRLNHSIARTAPIECRQAILPIPPYTFGTWLGDGVSTSGRITSADYDEQIPLFLADGFEAGKKHFSTYKDRPSRACTFTLFGLGKLLRIAGLISNKHIPRSYLFASAEQRLALLQGLMDTDGSITSGKSKIKGTRCTFANTNKRLIDDFLVLCRSLGIKARCVLSGDKRETSSPCWIVTFITTVPIFRLTRKADKIPKQTKPNTRRHFISSVKEVASRPVCCITVDSPSHTYLCGKGFIPTHNSSRSQGPRGQTAIRLKIINETVRGLAGPMKKTAILVPCTVICRGDLSDRLLDHTEFPEFRGERTKRFYHWPANKTLWEEYRELHERSLKGDEEDTLCNDFYGPRRATCGLSLEDHRPCLACPRHDVCMDAEAIVDWAARIDDEKNLSAIQAAMHEFYAYKAEGFAAEFQNEPLSSEGADLILTATACAAKYNGRVWAEVPIECTEVTMGVDVQMSSLWYVVIAWKPNATGYVIDYGVWPRQVRRVFTLADIVDSNASLQAKYPGRGIDGTIQAGLQELVQSSLDRNFTRAGGAGLAKISRVFVDSGKWPGAIANVKHLISGNAMMLCKGIGIKAGTKPMSSYKRKVGEQHGDHWYMPNTRGTREFPYVGIDVNHWKSFVHGGFLTPEGDPGAFTLYGDNAGLHGLFASHITAETFTTTHGHGRDVQEWTIRPQKPDNHWLDSLVYASAAASMLGISPPNKAKPGGQRQALPPELTRADLAKGAKR